MLVDEPNWDGYASQFDESGFEIYVTRALVDMKESRGMSLDIEAKLNTSEALDQIRTRFFKLSESSNQLNSDERERDRLLKRWEEGLSQFSKTLIGLSIDDGFGVTNT